jgi:hypothetical protein
MGIADQLERIGMIAAYGFGDKVLKGFIPQYLARISIDSCYEYIRDDKDLLANVEEKHWAILRKIARAARFEITLEDVVQQLQRSRPDVLSIIINHPHGVAWLTKQVQSCRQKLHGPAGIS